MRTSHAKRTTAAFLPAALALCVSVETDVLAQQQTPQGQEDVEEIVVTGSRIARRDYSAQSPLVSVSAETFTERANVGMEAALNQLPQFTAAGTQAANSSAVSFPGATAAPGAATLDLRQLGVNRNLVLIDGRRVQPVNAALVVDINTIPAAAIERVEVITGAAAAVYGADAIAGVTNFILKKNFEGAQLSAQSGVSEEGDGNETSLDLLLGAGFADGRGNVMLGANYSKRDIILGKNRRWVVEGWDDPGTSASLLPLFSNLTRMDATFGNAPTLFAPPSGQYSVDQNGHVFDADAPLDPAHPYTGPLGGASGFKINPDGTLGYDDREHTYLQLPLERYAVFGSGHMEITNRVEVFADARFSATRVPWFSPISPVWSIWSPSVPYDPASDDPDSPTFGAVKPSHPVPRELADLLNSRPVPDAPWTYSGGLDYLSPVETETSSNVYQVIGGLRGDATVGRNEWSWEVYVSHGQSTVNAYQPQGFESLPRLNKLFNADQYGEGFDVLSLPGAVPVAVTGHCTSGLPIFNADGSVDDTPFVSQDCADYVVLRLNSVTALTQDVVEGTVTGRIAEMPAGPLKFAFGADYRSEHLSFQPDSGFNANQDFPNVVGNIVLPVSVDGRTSVAEAYGELAIPLLKDKKLVRSLEIDPGLRYSSYNTVGTVDTYKLTADWVVNDRVRVRGGHQFANRAPNVAELFTPRGGSSIGFGTDACAYYPLDTPTWGNRPDNPNRFNVQTLCQQLMVRDGAPASLYVPGTVSADTYNYNAFGGTFYFPYVIGNTAGNPNLASESAATNTAGVVLRPAPRLTLSVDWFDIELTGSIGTPGHDTVYNQCLDARNNPLIADPAGSHTGAELVAGNPYCDLIRREYVGGPPLTPGNYGADHVYKADYINQGGTEVEGYDLQVDWGIGNFAVNVVATLIDKFADSPVPGAPFFDFAGHAVFDERLLSSVRYDRPRFSIGMRWLYLGERTPSSLLGPNAIGVDAHNQLDVFWSWRFGDRLTLRGGIDNLTNADPEVTGATTGNRALGNTSSDYDLIGRRYFVGVNVSW